MSTRGSTDGSFPYTYDGTMYTMRYLTVTYDDPEASTGYLQASSVNLLRDSPTTEIIKKILNETVTACIGYYSEILGTIASIAGIDITRLGANPAVSTLVFQAASEWMRIYTQVFSTYDQIWLFGSSVERVIMKSQVSGYYYDTVIGGYVSNDNEQSVKYLYSSHYSYSTWRMEQAAIAVSSNSPCMYDRTGNAEYKRGDVVEITHYESF